MSFDGIDTNFTLPPRYYTSNEIFEQELERIFYSKWIYVACDADIPKSGDYVALKLGKRSFFLQRSEKGEVRGYYNVCRHRGHELVQGEKGNSRRLICPYHNWTYNLEGKLIHARGMDPGFPTEGFGLNPIEVAVIGGLIFQGMPGEQKKARHLQSSASLSYKVFSEYDPNNLLLRQAYQEVLFQQMEEVRLRTALQRIQDSKIIIKVPARLTPFSFPIKVDSIRENLSSESIEDRVRKMLAG
jgi:nitrite reductase/ring-hydroxylating ferredoxin subunit